MDLCQSEIHFHLAFFLVVSQKKLCVCVWCVYICVCMSVCVYVCAHACVRARVHACVNEGYYILFLHLSGLSATFS